MGNGFDLQTLLGAETVLDAIRAIQARGAGSVDESISLKVEKKWAHVNHIYNTGLTRTGNGLGISDRKNEKEEVR